MDMPLLSARCWVTSVRRLIGAVVSLWLLPGKPVTRQALPGLKGLGEQIGDARQAMANAAGSKTAPAASASCPAATSLRARVGWRQRRTAAAAALLTWA